MVLTNAEIRPRPRPVSAITPDTPLHEVAINIWMCVERMVHAPSETLADREGFLPTGKPLAV